MRVLFMFLAVFATFPRFCAAQHVTDFDIRHFNTENGLPQNSINAIAPDEYGFIWMASEAGLLRYDGRNFKVYNRKNAGTLTSRVIDIRKSPQDERLMAISVSRKMLEIKEGRATISRSSFHSVFFPSWGRSVSPGHPLSYLPFIKYKQIDSMVLHVGDDLTAILTLRNGVLWYKGPTLISHIRLRPLKDFSSVFILDNALFLSYNQLVTGTLERVEPGKISKVQITGDFLKQVKSCPVGESFFETNDAVHATYLYSGQYLYLVTTLPDGNVNTRLILSGFDLVDHQIIRAYYDSTHERLFLGSRTEGLYILSRKKCFTAHYPSKNPFINVLYSLVPLNDSSVLTGAGTVFFTKKEARPKERLSLLERFGNFGYILFRSRKNNVWFCDHQYIYELDKDARHIIRKWNVPAASAISEGRDGNIWIGAARSGLYRIDSLGRLSRMLNTTDYIKCMEWETDTVCWIGTEGHLFRFVPQSGKIDILTALNNKVIRNLYIPRPGEIWICSYENGLYLLKDGKLTSFPIEGYPALQTVHKILEDKNGFFWISTNNGLYQVSRSDLLRHHYNPAFRPYYFRYGIEAGFLTNEFNGSGPNAATKVPNGFFAFASMKGVVFFKPEATMPELPTGRIIIDHIVVDEQEIDTVQGQITLKREFERISIVPATAFLGDYANLKYEFNLNHNAHWQKLTGESIIYSALPSGHNYLTIRKRSGFGKNSYVYCTLDIYVLAAWWDHTWFYVALVIVLALLFWLVIRLRTRYWRQRSQSFEEAVQNRTVELNSMVLELERSEEKLSDQLHFQRMLNENITHDVHAPLKYLTIYTNEVLEQVKGNKLPDISEAEHIHDATNRIYALVDNLTKFLKTRYKRPTLSSINVHDLVQQKLDMFRIGAKRKSNQLENNTAPDLFVNQNEILLGILLHNLIDNAVKYTVSGRIFIQTHCDNEGLLSLRVHDTGHGMPAEQVLKYNHFFRSNNFNKSERPLGFGFILVKEIAKILGMKVSMESVLNKGTIVTVTISAYHSNHS